jgi:di/tricarboxylate transporter
MATRNSGPGRPEHPKDLPDDGTRQLLIGGFSILGAGLFFAALLLTVLGGIGVEGARNNAGWLVLILGAMCLPFGLLLTLLGIAKWLRRRSLTR